MKLQIRKWERKRIVAAAMGITLLAAAFLALPKLWNSEEEQPITIQSSDGRFSSEPMPDEKGKNQNQKSSSQSGNNRADGSDLQSGSNKADGSDQTDSGKGDSKNETESLMVDVDGAVKNPGVVTVAQGSRVFQALELAGGLAEKADTSQVNLARLVEDGEKIYIPSQSEASGSAPSPVGSHEGNTGASPSAARININQATSAQLQQLPGVGPATAEKILEYRRENGSFHKVEELKNVSGIGEKIFARLRDKISV